MKLALFDLDGTLIDFDSNHAFAQYMGAQGWLDGVAGDPHPEASADAVAAAGSSSPLPPAWQAQNARFDASYRDGTLDMDAYVAFNTAGWRARPLHEAQALRDAFVRERIATLRQPRVDALLAQHRAGGHTLVCITATNRFVAEPVARALGFEHVIAVELARGDNGQFSGAVLGTPSFRAGKVTRVTEWLAQQGLAWRDCRDSWFYSDSINDLPLLEHVRHPVVTQPDPQLAAVARERGWPVMNLFDP